jgi:hypothetical protein
MGTARAQGSIPLASAKIFATSFVSLLCVSASMSRMRAY